MLKSEDDPLVQLPLVCWVRILIISTTALFTSKWLYSYNYWALKWVIKQWTKL